MKSGKVLLGALAGVAAGAILGILFAPEKGSATRRKISKKSDEYAEGLGDKFNDFIDGITQKFESLKADATDLLEDGKEKTEDVISDVRTAANAKMNQIRS